LSRRRVHVRGRVSRCQSVNGSETTRKIQSSVLSGGDHPYFLNPSASRYGTRGTFFLAIDEPSRSGKETEHADNPSRRVNPSSPSLIMPRTSCPARRAARAASHSGSWYTNVPGELADQISTWMDAARGEHPSSPDTKAIIAPHAGYAYSGRTMAYAYTSLPDPDTISTIFILGPSHHFYSDKCHISQCSEVWV
jgi:hypothetical protein